MYSLGISACYLNNVIENMAYTRSLECFIAILYIVLVLQDSTMSLLQLISLLVLHS